MVQFAGKFLKKWSKKRLPPFWAFFGNFGGFPVKTVSQTGLTEDASKQRKRYTTRASRRPSQGFIWAQDMQGMRNTPSGGPPRRPTMGDVLFLCWLASSARPVRHTVFTGNPPKLPKSAQNGVTTPQINGADPLLSQKNNKIGAAADPLFGG